MEQSIKDAAQLHKNVPPDWYYRSIKSNILQRFWHKTRFQEVKKLIEPSGGKILDIGSADGIFTNQIFDKSKAEEIIGIDVLKTSVDWANNHWNKNKKINFRVGDAHNLKFKANSFDAVFALEVLEHVFEPMKVFREVKRVLKRGGYFVALVPTDNLLFSIIWWFVTKFWWARIWDDCHVQSFNHKNSLGKAIERAGLKMEVDRQFLLGMLNVVKARKI